MIDFPASPTNNQIFVAPNGVTYIWDGKTWNAALTPVVIGTARARNLICNPSMQVSQENGMTSSPAAATGSYYEADQWLGRWSVTGASLQAGLLARSYLGPKSPNTCTLYTGTPKVSLAAGDYFLLTQPIEGAMAMQDLQWGTSQAVPAVLTFWAVHTTGGTYSVRIANAASDRSFIASYTLAAGVPKKVVVPIPAKTDGVWPLDNVLGLSVEFANAVGSSYIGVAGWQNANLYGVPGQSNGAAVAATSLSIAEVGLYADPDATGVPPPFAIPDYGLETLKCQRYWYKATSALTCWPRNGGDNLRMNNGFWPTAMRTTPSLVAQGLLNYTGAQLGMNSGGSYAGYEIYADVGNATNTFNCNNLTASARM
jgi:hypothetical protein